MECVLAEAATVARGRLAAGVCAGRRPEEQADVVPTERERVGQGHADPAASRLAAHVIQIALRVGVVEVRVGGSTPRPTARALAAASTAPEAPSMCPVTALIELTAGHRSPNTDLMALVSARSPILVLVPCALM